MAPEERLTPVAWVSPEAVGDLRIHRQEGPEPGHTHQDTWDGPSHFRFLHEVCELHYLVHALAFYSSYILIPLRILMNWIQPDSLGPPGGATAQYTAWPRELLPNASCWIPFLRCCTPFGDKKRKKKVDGESSEDFLNVVLSLKLAGKIPGSWYRAHKHDAPCAKSFHCEVSAASPLIQLFTYTDPSAQDPQTLSPAQALLCWSQYSPLNL